MESILTSIKKPLGITEEYEQFDQDIIMHINTVLSNLSQLNVGPEEGFYIADKSANWSDFMTDIKVLNFVKAYMFIQVKLLFDPPQSSSVVDSLKRKSDELEWRILAETDKSSDGGD